MDIGEDFITPEFLNILFFQQKNLVIFPYVDLKHLHALEIFATGHNIVDLESTVLHDLKNILEFEASNSYSQNPTLYFIYNLDTPKVKEIMVLDGIRCILNSNENISELVNGSQFVFYNKKNGTFLNYPDTNLNFEKSLISSSTSPVMLQDSIQNIKSTATRIFEQMNLNSSEDKVAALLKDYDTDYWEKILGFTSRYYHIQLPNVSELLKYSPDTSPAKSRAKDLHDFSDEYEVIVSKNRAIGKEFVQLIHEYRSERVNSSHLELEELFSPLKLYNYLRNRHWKNGIPESFIKDWSEMKLSSYELSEEDIMDFEDICSKLGIAFVGNLSPAQEQIKVDIRPKLPDKIFMNNPPSVYENWQEYRKWLMERMGSLSSLIEKALNTQILLQDKVLHTFLLKELSGILMIIGKMKKFQVVQRIGKELQHEIDTRLSKVKIKEWIELFNIQDKFRMISFFRKYIERLYNDFFSRDPFHEKLVPKIKALVQYFQLPKKLESNLLWLNSFRNKLTHDDKYSDTDVGLMLSVNLSRIHNIMMRFIAGLITSQLRDILQTNRHLSEEVYDYIRTNYFDAEYVSTLPLSLLHERILVV